MASYAWMITTDHLFDPSAGASSFEDESGVIGPRMAPDHMISALRDGKGKTFRMYDDDGQLYYTGRLITTDDGWGDEDVMVAPLIDFGRPNAGAILIKWHAHPEWTCEA